MLFDERLNTIKVIGLGRASLDCLGVVPFYPDENNKIEITDLHFQCGGPVSTALATLSRLGIKTSFLGSISDDYFGLKILKGLEDESIDTSFLKIIKRSTSQFAFISINKSNGNRNVFWHRGEAPFLEKKDIDLSHFKNARILHLDGLMIDASIEAAKQARGIGIKIVFDAGTFRPGSGELISLADYLIASEGFTDDLLGRRTDPETALRSLRNLCKGDIVITLGAKGSAGLSGTGIIFQKALPVHSVDTTGAGDVYHGAYIYGILQDWTMSQCMKFASVTAALKCREIGARNGIPSLEEIKKNMDNAG